MGEGATLTPSFEGNPITQEHKILSQKLESLGLMWADFKHNITMLGSCAPVLQLNSDTKNVSDHVSILWVTILSDLTLEKHVPKTCAATGCANLVTSGGRSMKNQQQLLCMFS